MTRCDAVGEPTGRRGEWPLAEHRAPAGPTAEEPGTAIGADDPPGGQNASAEVTPASSAPPWGPLAGLLLISASEPHGAVPGAGPVFPFQDPVRCVDWRP